AVGQGVVGDEENDEAEDDQDPEAKGGGEPADAAADEDGGTGEAPEAPPQALNGAVPGFSKGDHARFPEGAGAGKASPLACRPIVLPPGATVGAVVVAAPVRGGAPPARPAPRASGPGGCRARNPGGPGRSGIRRWQRRAVAGRRSGPSRRPRCPSGWPYHFDTGCAPGAGSGGRR